MKKKFVILLLATALTVSTTACGGNNTSEEKETVETTETEEDFEEPEAESDTDAELEALGEVEVEEELFSVTITMPAEYVGETTQEELDETASELGYKVTLNDDGSATYKMTKSQHKQFLEELRSSFNDTLNEMVGSEDYPNITEITANDNFTSFTVTTTSTELDFNESFSVLAYYMYGSMYSIFSGEEVDNIHVDFVNADSGEIISSGDSSDMESAE